MQNPQPLTVSQLTHAIKMNLESSFPLVHLQGEVSNCKLHSSGHFYFSLKDSQAQISAVMFRGQAAKVRQIPKDGDQVVVKGQINVYPPSGRYQIVVSELEHAGIGELLLKLEALKKEIHQRGWFRAEHKVPLPDLPERIGVVTSPTGAAIQDMLNVLSRRGCGFRLILNPVRAQGEGAAAEIARAIQQFNETQMVDVIICGRGGGSIEDLWAFNEEIVAEAIFNSKIPIICAVGHETDHCIAEYVADVRAPTPSAAAELVMAEAEERSKQLQHYRHRIDQAIKTCLRQRRQSFRSILQYPIFSSPYPLLGPWIQRLDDQKQQIDRAMTYLLRHQKTVLSARQQLHGSLNPIKLIRNWKEKFEYFRRGLHMRMEEALKTKQTQLRHLIASLEAANPKNLLNRGYAILLSEKEGQVIKSVRNIKNGAMIRALVSDGELLTTVKEVKPGDR